MTTWDDRLGRLMTCVLLDSACFGRLDSVCLSGSGRLERGGVLCFRGQKTVVQHCGDPSVRQKVTLSCL